MSTIPSAEAGPQRSAPTIEDLVANAGAINPPEIVAARGVPVDERATAELKGDTDRLDRLGKAIDLEDGAKVLDVAVRGSNVSFVVEAADGSTHRGFVPVTALGSSRSAGKAAEAGQQSAKYVADGQPRGGTADLDPTSHTSGPGLGGTPTPANPDVTADGSPDTSNDVTPAPESEQQGGPTPTAPDGYEGLNVTDAAKYVTEQDEDKARAALEFERSGRSDGPRKGVIDAGEARFTQS